MDSNNSTSRISIRQAATMLDITPQTLKRALVATGKLRVIEITPRRRYVLLSDVEQLLNPFPPAEYDGAA
jgi:hypothetical protein